MVVTAALQYVFYDLLPGQGPFIAGTVLAWSAYFAVRIRESRRNLEAFGLSTKGLRKSAEAASAVFLVGLAICIAVGAARGALRFGPHMLILALAYPVWGLVQQLLVQATAVRNLAAIFSRPAVIVIAGVLFGLVHLPHLELAAATAILGAVFTGIFLRWRNVWPLGICHGLLGVFFYFRVLGRDPLAEILKGR